MEFHVIPWNLGVDTMTRAVPWNSMELGVCQFRWHKQFHGTWSAPNSMTRAVPWNSMEFHDLWVRQFRWHEQFQGIPWNLESANFDDTSSSMEFHGIPWNFKCANFADTSSSMDFHGIPWNKQCANFPETRNFPWNCSCHRNWRTPNSMEFHGTARVSKIGALLVPWNFMEFHGTARVSEIGALQIPWNSMELSAKLAHPKFHGIPWSCSCHRNWRTPSSMEFHGTARVIEIGALQVPWNSMELHYVSKYLSKSLFSAHWNLFWSKSSMELSPESHGIFLTTFEQHMWFHGIPWNLSNKTPSSMEFCPEPKFHGTFSILPSSMEIHGTFNFIQKSSMEFHGTFMKNFDEFDI